MAWKKVGKWEEGLKGAGKSEGKYEKVEGLRKKYETKITKSLI